MHDREPRVTADGEHDTPAAGAQGDRPANPAPRSKQKSAAEPADDDGRLPSGLRGALEHLSGIDLADVRVRRNSSEPGKVGAAAFTEGTRIQLGPGQDHHLPHEAWHAVQQKQGRVAPMLQMKSVGVNVDRGLERDADVMGARAVQLIERLPDSTASDAAMQVFGQAGPTIRRRTNAADVRQMKCGGGRNRNPRRSEEPTAEADERLLDIAERGDVIDVEFAYNQVRKGRFETELRSVQTYRIRDTGYTFYAATSEESVDSIRANGLDPDYGGKRDKAPEDTTQWNSRGHVYLALDEATARGFGKRVIGRGHVILRLTLPEGHEVTVDPEIRSGLALRTKQPIPAGNIQG